RGLAGQLPGRVYLPEICRRARRHLCARPRNLRRDLLNTQMRSRPVRAYREQYLKSHPGGALIEEALALAIEAAQKRGDPRARELAGDSRARFPQGRFHDLAERVDVAE